MINTCDKGVDVPDNTPIRYYYNKQIKSYLGMFMAAFADLHVETGIREDGTSRFMNVPVVYGSRDRVVASILADNTQNKALKLPAMSVYMAGLDLAEHRMKGSGFVRNTPYVPDGGLIPDDVRNVKQRMPTPYDLDVELAIYTSNMDQHLQIVEQITMLFDPSIQLERSDAPFDWAKVVTITLTGISFDENYPIGSDRRKIQSTMRFKMSIWIETPAVVRDDLIKVIKLRIQSLSDLASFTDSVIWAPDDSYETIVDASAIAD